MIGEALLSLVAIGAGGAVGKKLFNAACYGIKRFLEPYFIAHEEKVKAKTELAIFRKDPLKQLEFAQVFLKNADGQFPTEKVEELGNICKVIQAAVGYTEGAQMDESPYTEAEDKEWYARFFDEIRYISDSELQEAWGRLMAERMIHPDGVNNRVLYYMRGLDKREIDTIRRVARIFLNDDFIPDYIIDKFDGMTHDFPILLSLDLAYKSADQFHPLVTGFDLSEDNTIEGKGYQFKVSALGEEKKVEVPCYGLTPEGQVLSRLCDSELTESEAQTICDHLNECWKDKAKVVVEKRNNPLSME